MNTAQAGDHTCLVLESGQLVAILQQFHNDCVPKAKATAGDVLTPKGTQQSVCMRVCMCMCMCMCVIIYGSGNTQFVLHVSSVQPSAGRSIYVQARRYMAHVAPQPDGHGSRPIHPSINYYAFVIHTGKMP